VVMQLGDKDVISALIGYAMAGCISFVLAFTILKSEMGYLRESNSLSFNVDEKKVTNYYSEIDTFCWKIRSWGWFTMVLMLSDKWSLEIFHQSASVGIYALAFQLGNTPSALLSGVVLNIVQPILYDLEAARSKSGKYSYKDITYRIVAVSIILAFSIAWGYVAGSFIKLFNADMYASATDLCFPLSLSAGVLGCCEIIAINLLARFKLNALRNVKILTSSVGIVGCAVGSYIWGLQGVVYSIFAVNLLQLILLLLLSDNGLQKLKNT